MIQVTLTGWRDGLNKVLLNHLLRQDAGFRLGEAKRAVDALLDGETVACEFSDIEAATLFSQSATALGAVCSAPESLVESHPSASNRST